ncbi:MAG TPA: Maf and M48 domain-containing protein [Candidatus Omnitrophota bacterium]|nr:Maf and M48 domain-containing protein [Candidatus Omnitrophota bacterium]
MIYLASRSKARYKILKNLGIKFRVLLHFADEFKGKKSRPKKVVMVNALLKARAAAKKVKTGFVIGCDTLVWQNGRVFGKPRDLAEARMMLKKLSSKPHRLYTGIAVIDVKNKKEIVDFEETKIEMERLSDKEITNYFRKVDPMDKAGAFDIQGLGGLFIKRIEGCFFNVVGLPVSKMFVIFKKLKFPLLMFLMFMFAGCAKEYNVASNSEDLIMYSTDKEVGIGDSVAKQVEKEYNMINDPELNSRVKAVGEKVAAVCDRKELFYRFTIIEDKKDPELVNAVSMPGGHIYVFRKLLDVAKSDDELAAVLGHEIAHVVARHGVKRLQAAWGYTFLTILATKSGSPDLAQGTQIAFLSLLSGYSQEDELVADRLGARYAKKAGYDPDAMIIFLDKLQKRHKKEPPQALSYFRTHPYNSFRVKEIKQELGERVDFEDFINTV